MHIISVEGRWIMSIKKKKENILDQSFDLKNNCANIFRYLTLVFPLLISHISMGHLSQLMSLY